MFDWNVKIIYNFIDLVVCFEKFFFISNICYCVKKKEIFFRVNIFLFV